MLEIIAGYYYLMKSMFLIVIASLLYGMIHNQTDKQMCKTKSKYLQRHLSKPQPLPISLQYYNFINLYSGKTLFDMGDYDQCLSFIDKTKFFIVSLMNLPPDDPNTPCKDPGCHDRVKFPTEVTKLGLCYFIECDLETMEEIKINWIDLINKYNITDNIDPRTVFLKDVDVIYHHERDSHSIGIIVTIVIIGLISMLYTINGVAYEESSKTKTTKTEELNEKILYKEKGNFLKKLLLNFSFAENFGKIFAVKTKRDEPLRIFDGVRVLSSGWVVFGHSFFVALRYKSPNLTDTKSISQSFWSGFVFSAYFSVDVFFYMAAFMLYLSMQKYITKAKSSKDELLIAEDNVEKPKAKQLNKWKILGVGVLGRYIRLLPIYLFTIFGITSILPYLSKGSLNHMTSELNKKCNSLWWQNLLYINNMFDNLEGGCVGHGWYLANDFQFFLLFFIIFLFLNERKIARNVIVFVIIFLSLAWSEFYTIMGFFNYNDLNHDRIAQPTFFQDYYEKPYIRVAPYILGLYFCEFYIESRAYPKYKENKDPTEDNFIRKINKRIENSNRLSIVMLILSLVLINYSCFSVILTNLYDVPLSIQATMLTVNKILFVLGVGMIVHLTFLGKFKFIHYALTLDLYNIVGKLTFGIYLLHIYVYYWIYANGIVNPYFISYDFLILAAGVYIVSTILSVIASMLFESPVISLLKGLL